MRILVTGAAGFIGARAVELLSPDHEVVAVDSFDDYYSPQLKHLRATRLRESTGVEVLQRDLSNAHECASMFDSSIDAVIHLAARPGVRAPVQSLPLYVNSNVVALTNILTNVQAHDVPRVLYASSSSVYGDKTGSLVETDPVLKPVSYYGATKLAGELVVDAVSRLDDRVFIGLRFFTVYGPWGRPDMLMWRLIASALGGPDVRILGDGSAQRDFTYVDDIAFALTSLISHSNLPTGSSILNIGGGNPVSVRDIIDMVGAAVGAPPSVAFGERIPSDVQQTHANPEAISALLGQAPSTPIQNGVVHTVEWFRSQLASGTRLLDLDSGN